MCRVGPDQTEPRHIVSVLAGLRAECDPFADPYPSPVPPPGCAQVEEQVLPFVVACDESVSAVWVEHGDDAVLLTASSSHWDEPDASRHQDHDAGPHQQDEGESHLGGSSSNVPVERYE